jgi:hypothetical protein
MLLASISFWETRGPTDPRPDRRYRTADRVLVLVQRAEKLGHITPRHLDPATRLDRFQIDITHDDLFGRLAVFSLEAALPFRIPRDAGLVDEPERLRGQGEGVPVENVLGACGTVHRVTAPHPSIEPLPFVTAPSRGVVPGPGADVGEINVRGRLVHVDGPVAESVRFGRHVARDVGASDFGKCSSVESGCGELDEYLYLSG